MEIKTKYNIGDDVWFQYFGQELNGKISALMFHSANDKGTIISYVQYTIDDLYVLEEKSLFPTLNELLENIEEND